MRPEPRAQSRPHVAQSVWLVAAWLLACAPALPPAYRRARDDAEHSYATRSYADAARHWLLAAGAARSARDRNEALYRAATSYERSGQWERASELYERLARGKSERAARATFALADLGLQRGDQARGAAALEAAIRKYPSSGVANLALRRYFALLAAGGGDRAVLDYIARVEPELGQSELAEQLLYERAQRLEAQGRVRAARDGYVELARRFPYPHGAYWDDALMRAADCELRLGSPEASIELLESMLAARETAHLSGSYERPRFADAAYRLAELYRDTRHDLRAAQRAFRDVFNDYPTSTLRDDALWQEAALARKSGADSCAPLSLLVQALPDSRFVPCAHELCAKIAKIATRECASYIERGLE